MITILHIVKETWFYKKSRLGLNQPSFREFEKPFENHNFQISSNSSSY